MKNSHVIVTAVVLVGAAAAFNVASERRHEAELSGLRADMESLSVSVEKAQERPASKPLPPARAQASAPPVPAPRPEAEVEPEEEDSPGREAREEAAPPAPEPAELKSRLDTVFASEGADPSWTPEAKRTVGSRLTAVLPETSSVRGVDCHTSMCRIETSHQDMESYKQFVQGAFMSPETRIWNAGFFSSPPMPDERGEMTATVYLAREGEPLPLGMLE